ncbi:hypothetical protein ACHAWU_008384 [Discostella pseudostelligera]|uniref:Uncharacterized protein n=1 Tax=Discostella pseudostelligera TaxID=259834 RepID=A0ABD3M320_9STRA
MNNRMERWRTVISIIGFTSSKKTGSVGNISRHLLDVTNVDASALHRALSLELGSDVANRFGKRLHCAFQEDSSSKQTTSTAATVDARWIITTFRATMLAPAAFHDPRGVFLKLVQDYHLECIGGDRSEHSILLSDVVRVASIAAVNDKDVQSATVQLKKCIQGLTTSSVIAVKTLEEALELSPAALPTFRTQLLDKISDDKRLELLAGEEDKALSAFLLQSNKMLGEEQRILYQTKILRRTFAAWRMVLTITLRTKHWRKKHAFLGWLSESKRVRLSRLSTVYFCLSSTKPLSRLALRKLLQHKNNMKKIKRCYASDSVKTVCAGVGHLRMWLNRTYLRSAFMNWLQFNVMHRNLEVALRLHETMLRRRVVRLFKSNAMNEIQFRSDVRIASAQQSIHLTQIMDNDSALTSRTETSIAGTTLLSKREKQRRHDEARQRQRQIQKELDSNILLQQRDQRRQRVAELQMQRELGFQSIWDASKVAAEAACDERNKTWLLSSEFKHQSQKMQNEVHRLLSIKFASTTDRDREKAMASRAVISYSILDAKLAHVAGALPDELFTRLEPTTSPITSASFQSALELCGLILDGTEFEELFHGVAENGSIELHNLKELRQLAEKYVGNEGTRWKMYVCPVMKTMVIHNVVTDTKIFEKDVHKKHIRQMVIDNMQDIVIHKVRRKHAEARRHAHTEMLEHHAANSIQSLFHQSKARQSIKKQRWIVDRRKLQSERSIR